MNGANNSIFNKDFVDNKRMKSYHTFIHRILIIVVVSIIGLLFSIAFAPQILEYIIELIMANILLSSALHFKNILAIRPTRKDKLLHNQLEIIEKGENQLIKICNRYLKDEKVVPLVSEDYYTDFAQELDVTWQKRLGTYQKNLL